MNQVEKAVIQPTLIQKAEGFLPRLAEIFSDDKVKSFFQDYFSTWTDAQTALMMMHTFVIIDEGYYKQHGVRLKNEDVCAIVRKAMTDRNCRPVLVEAMKEFVQEGNQKFFNTFQRLLEPAIEMKSIHF